MCVSATETGWSICAQSGKRIYRTQAKAYVYLHRIQRKNKRKHDPHPVHVYRCPSCGQFHTGHAMTVIERRVGR